MSNKNLISLDNGKNYYFVSELSEENIQIVMNDILSILDDSQEIQECFNNQVNIIKAINYFLLNIWGADYIVVTN